MTTGIIRWNPEADLLRGRMDRLFNEMLQNVWGAGAASEGFSPRTWAPPVDIRETDEALVLNAELPGLTKEDVEITLENNVLTLAGERRLEKDVKAEPCDTYMEQHLIPYDVDAAYDIAFNILNFDPGVYFGFVECHVMEHGLYMLEGRGIYWLNGDYMEVQKDDFIYMAPYCPQFFYATGWTKGRYLIYKEINRDYSQGL